MDEYVPSEFYLCQNAPNPFKEITKIKYCLPFKTHVNLTLLNSSGEIIEILVNKIEDAGTYEIKFNGNDLQVGFYQYQLEAFNIEMRSNCVFTEKKKMRLLK